LAELAADLLVGGGGREEERMRMGSFMIAAA